MIPNNYRIFEDPKVLVSTLAQEFRKTALKLLSENKPFNIALSGGNTPKAFFQILASEKYKKTVPWEIIKIYWVDERCVPPNHSDSNYKLAHNKLLNKIDVPAENVHRICGENNPEIEAIRYSSVVLEIADSQNKKIPIFDWILLGLGTDGHTASIFPNSNVFKENDLLYSAVKHPTTQQNRITMTLSIINSARSVIFLVMGENKQKILKTILQIKIPSIKYPATYVRPKYGKMKFYIDSFAAGDLTPK